MEPVIFLSVALQYTNYHSQSTVVGCVSTVMQATGPTSTLVSSVYMILEPAGRSRCLGKLSTTTHQGVPDIDMYDDVEV